MAWWHQLVAVAVPLGGSFLVGALTPPPGEWYKSLNKPSWTPPNWAFPVVWTILYILMGLASCLVWQRGGFMAHQLALGLYAAQLLLNFCWGPLFFGLKRIDLALVEIVLLWLAVAATIGAFWGVSKAAAALLLPYILWMSLATCLSYYIYTNNPASPSELTQTLTTSGTQ